MTVSACAHVVGTPPPLDEELLDEELLEWLELWLELEWLELELLDATSVAGAPPSPVVGAPPDPPAPPSPVVGVPPAPKPFVELLAWLVDELASPGSPAVPPLMYPLSWDGPHAPTATHARNRHDRNQEGSFMKDLEREHDAREAAHACERTLPAARALDKLADQSIPGARARRSSQRVATTCWATASRLLVSM